MKRAREQEVENVEPKKVQHEKLLIDIQYIVREYLKPYEIAILDDDNVTYGHLIDAAEAGWEDGVQSFIGYPMEESIMHEALVAAAHNGHINIITILESVCKKLPIQDMCESTTEIGSLDTLIWLINRKNVDVIDLNEVLDYAILHNNYPIFQYCLDHGATFVSKWRDAVTALINRDDVKMLMMLPEITQLALNLAVTHNKPDIIQYCFTKIPPDENTMIAAIEGGHLDIIKMLIDRVPPCSKQYVKTAIEYKQNDVLTYLRNYYDLGCLELMTDAVIFSDEGAIRLMYSWGARHFQDTFSFACAINQLDMIPVLWELGRKKIDIAKVRNPIPPDILALWQRLNSEI